MYVNDVSEYVCMYVLDICMYVYIGQHIFIWDVCMVRQVAVRRN